MNEEERTAEPSNVEPDSAAEGMESIAVQTPQLSMNAITENYGLKLRKSPACTNQT